MGTLTLGAIDSARHGNLPLLLGIISLTHSAPHVNCLLGRHRGSEQCVLEFPDLLRRLGRDATRLGVARLAQSAAQLALGVGKKLLQDIRLFRHRPLRCEDSRDPRHPRRATLMPRHTQATFRLSADSVPRSRVVMDLE